MALRTVLLECCLPELQMAFTLWLVTSPFLRKGAMNVCSVWFCVGMVLTD